MLINHMNDSKTIIRKCLGEIFTKRDKTIYVIEKIFQRPLVWNTENINVLWCEIQEMLNVCSRLIVMRDRRIVGELKDEELSQDNIMSTIAGGSNHNE